MVNEGDSTSTATALSHNYYGPLQAIHSGEWTTKPMLRNQYFFHFCRINAKECNFTECLLEPATGDKPLGIQCQFWTFSTLLSVFAN